MRTVDLGIEPTIKSTDKTWKSWNCTGPTI